jgi:hypothetical protein
VWLGLGVLSFVKVKIHDATVTPPLVWMQLLQPEAELIVEALENINHVTCTEPAKALRMAADIKRALLGEG